MNELANDQLILIGVIMFLALFSNLSPASLSQRPNKNAPKRSLPLYISAIVILYCLYVLGSIAVTEWQKHQRRAVSNWIDDNKYNYHNKLERWEAAAREQLIGCNRSETGVVTWGDLCPDNQPLTRHCSIAGDLQQMARVPDFQLSYNERRQQIPHCERLRWNWGKFLGSSYAYDQFIHDLGGRDMVCMHFQAGYGGGVMNGGSWDKPRRISMLVRGEHSMVATNISMTMHASWSGWLADAQPLNTAIRVRHWMGLAPSKLDPAEGMWSPTYWTVAMTCCPANMPLMIPKAEWDAGCRRSCAHEHAEICPNSEEDQSKCAACKWRRDRSVSKFGCVASE